MKLEIRELLLNNGFKEIGYKSGIYILDNYKLYFFQKEWTIENWLTIELIQGKNKFLKYNNFVYIIEDIKYLIKLIMKKELDAH